MQCDFVKIKTPKKFLLNGLYFGPENPKRIFICIHGLCGSMFSGHGRVLPLINNKTGVLFFSNRGAETIAKVSKIDKRDKGGLKSFRIGGALEKFTDCVDDIAGAVNFAKVKNIKEIFLIGHSTGCQKAIYYLSKKDNQKNIKAVFLLSPMSDYADGIKIEGIDKVIEFAKNMVKNGDGNQLIPYTIWKYSQSANRLLSLVSPDSKEEIFCYAQKGKIPVTIRKIKVPTCIILAEKDENKDRSIREIANWFKKNIKSEIKQFHIIKGADHSFTGKEIEVSSLINEFVKDND